MVLQLHTMVENALLTERLSRMATTYGTTDYWTTMNYGYAEIAETGCTATSGSMEEQFNLKLYSFVATLGPDGDKLQQKELLEIGSGRGGGAAHLARFVLL